MRNLFRSLLRPRVEAPNVAASGFLLPPDLTEANLRQLQSLRASPEWEIFASALDSLVNFNAESLLSHKSVEDLNFYRGYISGLRRVASIIDEFTVREAAHVQQKIKEENARAGQQDRSNLYGTPAFGRR